MALFEYGKSTIDYQYYFQLRDNNQQIIITSANGYPNEEECKAAIDSVKKIASDASLYQLFTSNNNQSYFELRGVNNIDVCKSEGYNSSFYRDCSMELCMKIAPEAGIRKIVPFSKLRLTEF